MTKISIMELQSLRKDISCSKSSVKSLEILLKIGEENLIERGIDLLGKIKMIRGLSDEEISEYTGVPAYKIKDILSGRQRITKLIAEKLAKLGYETSLFREDLL